MIAFGVFWAVAGVVCILFTATWHAGGQYAVLGVFCLALSLLYAAAAFERRRHSERPDSIR